jgi:DNA-binding LacI/PurR family transcriptional regulator
MPQREPTLRDVAVRTGLSVTTVSQVLSDAPGRRIAEPTRQRVRAAAAELRTGPIDWPKGFASGGRRRSGSSVPGLARHPTTIELPHYDMGRWAVLELLKLIESGSDRPAPHVALPCPLVRRGSTATVPRGD